jgi:AraC-like DNA-binding protein
MRSDTIVQSICIRRSAEIGRMTMQQISASLAHTVATIDRHDSKVSILERLRGVFGELFAAVSCPDERIRRASDLLRSDPELHQLVMPETPNKAAQDLRVRGGLTARNKRLLKTYIEEHLDGTLKNADFAILAGLSESRFCRAFKDSFGDSPHRYILRLRIERARRLLLTTNLSLSRIGIDCGLSDQAHFCRLFRKFQGESPGEFRRARYDACLDQVNDIHS